MIRLEQARSMPLEVIRGSEFARNTVSVTTRAADVLPHHQPAGPEAGSGVALGDEGSLAQTGASASGIGHQV